MRFHFHLANVKVTGNAVPRDVEPNMSMKSQSITTHTKNTPVENNYQKDPNHGGKFPVLNFVATVK